MYHTLHHVRACCDMKYNCYQILASFQLLVSNRAVVCVLLPSKRCVQFLLYNLSNTRSHINNVFANLLKRLTWTNPTLYLTTW